MQRGIIIENRGSIPRDSKKDTMSRLDIRSRLCWSARLTRSECGTCARNKSSCLASIKKKGDGSKAGLVIKTWDVDDARSVAIVSDLNKAQSARPRSGATGEEIDDAVHEFFVSRGAYPSPLNYRKFPKSLS